MEADSDKHPSPEVLSALLAGRLDGAAAKTASSHVERCPACRALLAGLPRKRPSPKRLLLLGAALGMLLTIVPLTGVAWFLLNGLPNAKWANGSDPSPEKAAPQPERELPKNVIGNKNEDEKEPDKSPVKETPANLRTTANGIEYELASSRMNGRVWELTLKATRRTGNRGSVVLWRLQATTEDGKEFQLPPGKVTYQQILFSPGKPTEIKITMNKLPPGATKWKQVALVEHGTAFSTGTEPVVFLEVPIAPDQGAARPPGDGKK